MKPVMKVILVVDVAGWAFDNIARNIAARVQGANFKIVYASSYQSHAHFLRDMASPAYKADVIHFFWRDYLREVLDYLARNDSKYKNLFLDKRITTHIPDHLFIDDIKEREARLPMMSFVDGYFVTSKKLFDIYSGLRHVAPPMSVIHDSPLIDSVASNRVEKKDTVEVVWVGNSEWGDYLGYTDHKGLNGIVKPAMLRIKNKHNNVVYIEFDKAKSYTKREEIIKALAHADILVVSSMNEGTPLPLIEAMAHNCAIVTSDVGVAKEILPDIQQEFIVRRDEDSFFKAIDKLCADPALLNKIKEHNGEAYNEYFNESGVIEEKWKSFFEDVISSDRALEKRRFFEGRNASKVALQATRLLSAANGIANRVGITNVLKSRPKLRGLYHSFLSKANRSGVNYGPYKSSYQKLISGKEVVALYSAYWFGVASSTDSFFGDDAIAYPLFSSEYPNVKEHPFLDDLTAILAESPALKCVVVSGGTLLQMEVAKKLKAMRPKIKVFFAWHGSPAQWSDISQYFNFNEWRCLYNEGVVDGFVSFKPELDKALSSLGIRSFSVKNYIIETPYRNRLLVPTDSEYKVGLFAAMFSWYKNPFPQLVSLAGVGGCDLVTNLPLDQGFSWMAEHIKVKSVSGSLSNRAFVNMLADLHVVLYVTNTECSPMIALESVAVLTPCIVGPAGNIYKGYPELEQYLVVAEVDNPTMIAARLEDVRENYEKIKELLVGFKDAYNSDVDTLKSELFNELVK